MTLSPRQALWMIAAGATFWFGLVLLAPALPPALGAIVYAIGSLVCHQRPERSFHWAFHGDSAQLAVCARCAGIYAGAALALVAAALGFLRGRPPVDMRVLRAVLLAAALPTAITVGAEWAGWWLPSHATRAASGLLLGAGAALAVAAALAPRRGLLHYGECLPPAAAASRPPQTPM